jgi:formamidopyrimidine-DNA glycosylase
MDKNAEGAACPACGKRIKKIQYLGGACYFCPRCQQ